MPASTGGERCRGKGMKGEDIASDLLDRRTKATLELKCSYNEVMCYMFLNLRKTI